MKYTFTIIIALLLCANSTFAAIWRVNNRTSINANFTTISAAITAASNGDTIYVEPSTTSYGAFSLNKKLTIIGNGYFSYAGFSISGNQGLQADSNQSVISGYSSFDAGSAGSTVMGLVFYGYYTMINDTAISIKRNLIYNTTFYINKSQIDIRQNYIYYYSGISNYTSGTINNINIQNNIFSYTASISLPNYCSGVIQNNIFDGGASMNLYNFQVNNNIMIGGSFTQNNSVAFNNIGSSTQFSNTNNNLQNITTAALFTNYTANFEAKYTLKPTGPGIGAGFNGLDVGIFGGPDPYKPSGIPPVPTIYYLSAPATTTTTTLPVTISTRSNN
ncbi:MAG: hypothetical protein JSS64_00195 [Bacteroidetes bacterium]|nr:hypothetical protein [Bacteroidota bacterium]